METEISQMGRVILGVGNGLSAYVVENNEFKPNISYHINYTEKNLTKTLIISNIKNYPENIETKRSIKTPENK